jgi:hypothetical protein
MNLRLATAAAVATIAALAVPATAAADHGAAPIHPGVMTVTAGGQCTSNFVFRDGGNTYLGQAAHCASTGAATDTDGCITESLPLGTPVDVDGATQPGTLAYSSWLAMQSAGETDANTCAYNDFALVRLAPADVPGVDPTVPGFGGPTGVGGSAAGLGDTVYSYQNSSLRLGIPQLRPKQGVVIQSAGANWSRTVLTATAGIPGDSGSGFLNANGQAIGVLATLQVLPLAGSNGVGDLAKELAYAQGHGLPGLQLVPGNRPFRPNLVQAILGD